MQKDAMVNGSDTPQGEAVYRQLIDEIKSGTLLPGARLREVEVSTRFGISRTPVREAIRLLERDGLVVHLPRQGATIRGLDYAEIIELYEMRMVLEGTAARLAARVASAAELDGLAALHSAFATAAVGSAAHDLNRQFHNTLVRAARNRFLIKALSALQKTLLILGPTTLADVNRLGDAVGEHADILGAIRDGDGPRAEAAMRAHIEAALKQRIAGLRSLDLPMEDDL
jgi:DNA-binding GntR family transcriptional regulator